MIKFKQGWVESPDGVRKDVVVKALLPNKVKDILIGGLFIGLGVAHIAVSAFKNGSEHCSEAELATLDSLGLLEDLK